VVNPLQSPAISIGTIRCAEALPSDGAAALESDLAKLPHRMNTAGERSRVVPSEHLEIVSTRR
jgi:hypothetical protein